jgi:hypothetical protein
VWKLERDFVILVGSVMLSPNPAPPFHNLGKTGIRLACGRTKGGRRIESGRDALHDVHFAVGHGEK